MTTIITNEARGLAERMAEAFSEEYATGLDRMDEEDAVALATYPTMGVRAETLADPTAEADYGEILDRMCGDTTCEDAACEDATCEYDELDTPLTDGHVVGAWLPESSYCAAVWEEESPYLRRSGDSGPGSGLDIPEAA